MPRTLIDDLVNEWFREVFFGSSFVQVAKVSADMNGALFFENRNRIGHPSGVFNGIDNTSLLELIDFSFDRFSSGRINGSHLLVDRIGIRPCIDMVFDNGKIKSGHF